VIDVADFNDDDKLGRGQEMVDKLSKLVGIFQDLDLHANRAEGDDLLGDAYEYLMRHFATESGKSKGQFYTPAEVSRVMSKVIGISNATRANETIYDPTCGSGSLLIKAHDEAKSTTGLDLGVFGQEMDNATEALAKMNMILHDIATAEIWQGNVLAQPYFKQANGSLQTFDFIVANPPFSFKAWRSGFNPAEDEFRRFELGVPPAKNGDLAFLLHILASLKSTGKAAVNLPHGVLFRGGAEAVIRREIVRRGYIKGIIGLPANLFYGTGIPACIVVLDKENAAARKGIFMIDASKGLIKDGNKNRLRAQDIHKIVDAFTRLAEIPRYSRMVSLAEISDPKNDYNLDLHRYINTTEPGDLQDIDAHLRGGIPDRDLDALSSYWEVFPSLRSTLFESAGRERYSVLKVPVAELKNTISDNGEFQTFKQSITRLFEKWKLENRPRLENIAVGDKPKPLIETLSENLLETFRAVQLLDAYDVYQHLMDYWANTMQDDLYMLVSSGWKLAAQPRLLVEQKGKKSKEKPDLVVGKKKFKTDLLHTSLVIARYFAAEQSAIDSLNSELEAITAQLAELEEEHGSDGGALDLPKVNEQEVNKRLKEAQAEEEADKAALPKVAEKTGPFGTSESSETEILLEWLNLNSRETALKKKLKAAEAELQTKTYVQYAKLTEDEIKTLVVDDKWLGTIATAVRGELERSSQTLTARIRDLAERYATPLPQLTNQVAALAERVDKHLQKMGAVWK
jgi:type I restriction enzyme M protein